MGMFDDLVQQAAAAAGGSADHTAMAAAVVSMLNSPQAGGLPGVLQSFHNSGLGDIAASWVGSG
ncbi:MAG TPA: YidB family protein, partial [Vicinamibacteria bacterium]|nr:YidB family protein [Vicinamibacteria bacterium]